MSKVIGIQVLTEINNNIAELELNIMGNKLSTILTGRFWKELKETKPNKYEYNGFTVKTKKTKVYY